MKKNKLNWNTILVFLLSFSSMGLMGQNNISGTILDMENDDPLIGVNIIVKNSVTGTITDLDGKYSLNVKEELPYTIVISLIGYENQEIIVTKPNAVKDIKMNFKSFLADEIVVSASRVEEKILESPVTIEKLDLIGIKQSSSADYYDELTKLKGVHTNQASMTFNTINTRGFATAGNTRFVQLMDGMDNAAPLLNFPTGNVVGISDLDISNIELVPGAASALYGPNAFNGILMMNSKNPFKYQGLSASAKGGMAMGDGYNNPLYGASVRYAKAFNDKLAFKVNLSYFLAHDWKANSYSKNIDYDNPNLKPGDPNFDGVNLYGDETLIPALSGFRRTGFKEEDLLESDEAKSIKLSGAIHYKLTDKIETNLSYRRGIGSTVYQGSERYALRSFQQEFIKFEVNSSNWNLRSYLSHTDAGDSYNLTALGAYTNEGLFPSVAYDENGKLKQSWVVTYVGAILGDYNSQFGIPISNLSKYGIGSSPADARLFADNGGIAGLPQATQDQIRNDLMAKGLTQEQALGTMSILSGLNRDENFSEVVENVRNGLFQQGGAGFIDDSKLYHTEFNYDFSDMLDDVIGLQIGANHRRYSLYTQGTIFNEDPDGTGKFSRINIDEFGIYTQVSKKLLDEKLKLTGSIRYDKNENFDGNITPRISAVYSIGEKRQHNIRASYQTGFRNPSTQGQFIFFPTTNILLGGTRANAERYGIFEGGALNSKTKNPIDLQYVKPEKLQSMEVGYKGILKGKLMVDANVYYNIYNDFIDQLNVISINDTQHKGQTVPAGTVWRPYTNSPAKITSLGSGIGLAYRLNRKWNVKGSFDYASYTVDEKALEGSGWEGYRPGFNTPELKFNIGVTNRRLMKNLGFGINYRWQSDYYYESSFGVGDIPAYGTLDMQFSYKLPSIKSVIKLGGSNLIGTPYITNIGNPEIGRLIFLSWTYDQFSN